MITGLLSDRRFGVAWRTLPIAAALVYVAVMAWLLQGSYEVVGAVLVFNLLLLPSVPLLIWAVRREPDRLVGRIIVAGAVAKLVGSVLRYVVAFGVYDGQADAAAYHRMALRLSDSFRQFDFTFDLGHRVAGTGFIEILTGLVYTGTGPTKLGGFIVFSWLGFLGQYLFYRSFRLIFPKADHRLYALLIFFLPSVVYWPSSIGKDAWMTLMLGIATYGTARLIAHRPGSFLWIGLGLAGTAIVRPHITITVVTALLVAYFFTGARKASFGTPLAKFAGLAVLLVAFTFVASTVQEYFKLDELGTGSIEEVLNRTEEQTSSGGSGFDAVGVRSPLQLPGAVFSVLFRPLPFEATNLMSLAASLEGVVLLGLFARHWRRLGHFIPRRRRPFIAFVATYSLLFMIAFSNFGNFGILARQRVQLFPFVLMLLCIPARSELGSEEDDDEAAEPEPERPQLRRLALAEV